MAIGNIIARQYDIAQGTAENIDGLPKYVT